MSTAARSDTWQGSTSRGRWPADAGCGSASAVAGQGLLGDRYQPGEGQWSYDWVVRRRNADRGRGNGPARAKQGVELDDGEVDPGAFLEDLRRVFGPSALAGSPGS